MGQSVHFLACDTAKRSFHLNCIFLVSLKDRLGPKNRQTFSHSLGTILVQIDTLPVVWRHKTWVLLKFNVTSTSNFKRAPVRAIITAYNKIG